jgi:hypothetical protein
MLAPFYALSGIFMKLSDDFHDKKKNKWLGVAAAILCGICIGYLAVNSADAACIFLAILIGTVAAWKVDCVNHLLSLLIFVGIILLVGFPSIGLITLLICAAAAFLDEIGNDSEWITKKKPLHIFFQYRFALKIVIFIFAWLGLFQTVIPVAPLPGIQFFSWETLLYFLLFEISYELVGLKFDAIYDGFYNFFRIFRLVDGPAND